MASNVISKIAIQLVSSAAGFIKGFRGADKAIDRTRKRSKSFVRSFITGFTKMIALALAFRAAIRIVGNILGDIFERENIQARILILERSVKKAAETFRELNRFAAETPLRLNDVAGAFILLRGLGGKKLGTIETLRELGDAALNAGQPIAVIAANVAKFFNALKKGDLGATADELRRYNLLSAKTEDIIVAMNKAGEDANDVFRVWRERELPKAAGAMKLLSQTTGGLISTLKDLTSLELGKALEPLIDSFRNLLKIMIENNTNFDDFAKRIQTFKDDLLEAVTNSNKLDTAISQIIDTLVEMASVTEQVINGIIDGLVALAEVFSNLNNFLIDTFGEGFFSIFLRGIVAISRGFKAFTTVGIVGLNIITDMLSGIPTTISKLVQNSGQILGSFFDDLIVVIGNIVELFSTISLSDFLNLDAKQSAQRQADWNRQLKNMGASVKKLGRDIEFIKIGPSVLLANALANIGSPETIAAIEKANKAIDALIDVGDVDFFTKGSEGLDKFKSKVKELIIEILRSKKAAEDLPELDDPGGLRAAGAAISKFAPLALKGSAEATKIINAALNPAKKDRTDKDNLKANEQTAVNVAGIATALQMGLLFPAGTLRIF